MVVEAAADGAPIRVLYVDDSASADGVVDALERSGQGISVTTAAGADGAMATLSDDGVAVDCLVAGDGVPEGEVLGFVEAVRADHPDLPVVLVGTPAGEAGAALAAGATDVVRAGPDRDALLAARIRTAVEAARSRARERRLDVLPGALPGVVYRCRPAPGRPLEYVGGAVEPFTGRPAAAVERAGDSLDEILIHPNDRAEVRAAVADAVAAGEPFDLTYRIVDADDGLRRVRDRGRPVGSSDGTPAAIEGYVEDDTERLRYERRLKRLHEATRRLSDAETEAAVAEMAVEAAETTLGFPHTAVRLLDEGTDLLVPVAISEGMVGRLGPDRPAYAPGEPTAGLAFERGETVVYDDLDAHEFDHDHDHSSGASMYVPIGDRGVLTISDTVPDAFDGGDRDMAEILAAHVAAALDRIDRADALRDQTRRIEALHEATQRLATAETESAVAEMAVEAAEDSLGFSYTAVRLFDEETGLLVPVALSDGLVERLGPDRPAYEPGEPTAGLAFECGETVVIADPTSVDDGIEHSEGASMYVPVGEHGVMTVSGAEANAFDGADHNVAEILAAHVAAALDRVTRTRRLRRQNERLEEFTRIVAHDLRNPLDVASSYLELVGEECESDHLPAVERAHGRMARLIDDLLSIARAEDPDVDPAPADIAAVAERAWRTVETADATLAVEATGTIVADEDRLTQLFENLFRNSVEHGGAGVTVSVGDLPDGFYVADDGPGIPESERERVFESGYSTGEGGTGFGLDIVTRIVDVHGWEIDLVEGADGGARFEITGVADAEAAA